MPCDLGFRSFTEVRIRPPKPLQFRKKVEAPKIDARLLRDIGEEDSEFARWLKDLDVNPMLVKALKQTLAKTPGSGALKFSIKNGNLTASASFRTEAQKRGLERTANAVGERFQMETLKMVAELLGYEVRLVEKYGGFILEGERHDPNSKVHKYLCIRRSMGVAAIQFEHFSSEKELALEMKKFRALAQKLGVPMDPVGQRVAGQPIPEGADHRDFLKEGE